MINTDTIKFIAFLDELAGSSENGIYPFSTATNEQKNGLLYDDKRPIYKALHNDKLDNDDKYTLIADCLIDNEHHDVISTYTQMYDADDIVIEVVVNEEENDVYVSVTSRNDPDFCIVIEDGRWYVVH